MYKHFLVPIDDTSVSMANVLNAVHLARSSRARITFFYAAPVATAAHEGERTHGMASDHLAEAMHDDTNALLTKAMACAHSVGVPCGSDSCTSDRPAEAIISAVLRLGCDLIVMASRGPTHRDFDGRRKGSLTERVLRHAPVPLLVTRVASAHRLEPVDVALGLLQDEHRSIAVVVEGMREIVADALARRGAIDRAGLKRMIAFLQEFPERVHHPKEELYLHRRLRQRAPKCKAMLATVEAQHEVERGLVDRVAACVALAGCNQSLQALDESVNALVDHVLQHIAHEERVVLPMARRYLVEEDWEDIAAAFSDDRDPRFGEHSIAEFRRMFRRIADKVADGRLHQAH